MKTWTIAGALILAGVMLTGSAFAQSTTGGAAKDKATTGGATGTSGTMKSDTGTSMKSTGKSGAMAGASREQVKEVQQALKDKGHDPGPIDGVMGPKTQAALKEFQSKEGLTESGRLDSETLAKLGVETTTPSASPGAGSTGGATTPGGTSSGSSGGTK